MTRGGIAGDAARGHRRNRGFALFIVLWFLVLLAAIGTYILASARTQSALARNILAAVHAEALADAGIARAVFNRSESDSSKRWSLDGTPYTVPLPPLTIALRGCRFVCCSIMCGACITWARFFARRTRRESRSCT